MSHDLLEDLLADVPRHVVPDAGRAWRVGAARRRRRYAAEGLAVAVLIGAVSVGLAHVPDRSGVGPAGKTATVTGHPESVPRPFLERELPAAPGPLAGVLDVRDGWRAVDQSGHSWELAADLGYQPGLSDDGTRLSYMVSDGGATGHLEVRDLVSGDVQPYPSVGTGTFNNGIPQTDQPYWAAEQHPSFFSPDGSALVVNGGETNGGGRALLLHDGRVEVLKAPAFPTGWASADTLIWLTFNGSKALVTDLDGTVLREVSLTSRQRGISQWSGRVSPDGSRLAVLHGGDRARIRTFSLDTGAQLSEALAPTSDEVWGGPVWQRDRVLVWVGHALVEPVDGSHVVDTSPRWEDIGFTTWSADSVAGPAEPGPGLSEVRYWQLWWRWRSILYWLVAVAGVAVVVLGTRRLNRRRRVT
jgi:hypothetical protein